MKKQTIGQIFLAVGFAGGFLGGWLSFPSNGYSQIIIWSYWLVYVGHLFAWKFLFDYTRSLELRGNKKHYV